MQPTTHPKGPTMATKQATVTTKQATTKQATLAPSTPNTQVLAQGQQAAYSVPTPGQWQAAPTGALQAALCFAHFANTMPPAHLPIAAGTVAPKGRQGGQRHSHGTYLQAGCNALGATATVGSVLAWARAQAKTQGCQHWATLNQGAARCAMQQGVIAVLPAAK